MDTANLGDSPNILNTFSLMPSPLGADGRVMRVAVGLSGGVDSSVSAYLLKEAGYEVVGVHMKCWDSKGDGCTAEQDRADAVEVAGKLGIRFEGLDYVKEYKEKVVSYFYNEYREGRTPNPDVMCNKEIKFGLFYEWAMSHGFDKVATGHYAQVVHEDGGYKMLRGVDNGKDQSYFLYLLDHEHLNHILFPVGGLDKKLVRQIAQKANLHTAKKPDSVGICFIGEVDIREFLKKEMKETPGNVVSIDGEIIGSHVGISFYTIGQRHGFNLTKYFGVPMYVISKNVERNELVVGTYDQALVSTFKVTNLHWINSAPYVWPLKCLVRIRHLGELHNGVLGIDGVVTLDKPVFGVAPGQSAVFYDDMLTLGGGIIV